MSGGGARQGGMTLIEVLVALLIFSFGLLGFVGLQAKAIQYSAGAEDSNRAALLANDMAAAMVGQNSLVLDSTTESNWVARVASPASGGLPGGLGKVTAASDNLSATLKITWAAASAVGAASAAQHQYLTQVYLP
jgi:type IV pilus assembly protein PilV